MDNDDRLVGRVLNRREVFKLLAVGGGAAAIGWRATTLAEEPQAGGAPALPPCVVRPELEEGPYFVDHQINRSDIRTDPTTGVASAGVPLTVAFAVSQISSRGCEPLPGALIDVWQCDARGVYSDVSGPGQRAEAGAARFLRGFQTTDANGHATFTTIYPGWYQGRAVHVHFKIRTTAAPAGAYEFTSQLFFDDTLSDQIHAGADYAAHGQRDTRNLNDHVFQSGGTGMMLTPSRQADGLVASAFAVGLDLSDAEVGRPDGFGGGGRRGPGGPGFGRGRGPGPSGM